MEDRVPKGKTNVSDQKKIIHGRVTYLCFSLFIIINQKIILRVDFFTNLENNYYFSYQGLDNVFTRLQL